MKKRSIAAISSNIRYRRFIVSKMLKTKVLLASSETRGVIPETQRLSRESLRSMLGSMRMVYVKPDIGTYGNGVIRVEWTDDKDKPYRFQKGVNVRSFAAFDSMYDSLQRFTSRRKYLVQKGIHLLKHRNRRFDLRIMVQQTPKKRWETTGIIGRVAAPRKIVTNFHNGGTLTPVEKLLKPYLTAAESQRYIGSLRSLGVKLASQLHGTYRGIKEIGADVGLDKDLKPWVLEVNTCPDPFIFRKLKDKRIFGKVMRYARAYGKYK
ncbi:YheC/YheD family protein [Paenibacillus thalictri]|uniref:YheC/YheD family protein n=1 Tax=Paenibacillus thalictri TaxID=2527873 RepID=A0A4Q9DQC0_9BACL|nr:YheC/YheD family protein [Paenibacillus thalictri]TBL76276.1 YheC/YheD family protein [Paenibacillus thalictri]